MRKAIGVSLICLAASLAFATAVLAAQTPSKKAVISLNAKTGLWQMTSTVKWTGLPPKMAASANQHPTIKYQSCVKPENLSSNPWADGSGQKCSWSVLSSTATDMEVKGNGCNLGKEWGMTADMEGKIHLADSGHGTASFDITLTGNGQTMHGHANYTGTWIGPSCPK
ncbi:MAG TPA: DUF3617 family protein [Verrucomicrobiae bacterium]|jgi:hypothetical protein|nr:DUF3617 family protein [Verrucomicrobiae bacterium]